MYLRIRQKLSKKSSVPSFRDMGAGDATKTGRSVLNFSEESARRSPGARKSPKNGNPENRRGVIPPIITIIILVNRLTAVETNCLFAAWLLGCIAAWLWLLC